jgi:hypothetical protein
MANCLEQLDDGALDIAIKFSPTAAVVRNKQISAV